MISRILQILWIQPQPGTYTCMTHCVVVELSSDEWVTLMKTADWLSERRKEISTSVTDTVATGGDITDLVSALALLAERYTYPAYTEDCPTLIEHGITGKKND